MHAGLIQAVLSAFLWCQSSKQQVEYVEVGFPFSLVDDTRTFQKVLVDLGCRQKNIYIYTVIIVTGDYACHVQSVKLLKLLQHIPGSNELTHLQEQLQSQRTWFLGTCQSGWSYYSSQSVHYRKLLIVGSPRRKGKEYKEHLQINTSRPSDAIWQQKTGSTLAQVMACCLMAPSHYLNQCWLIISTV